MPKNSGQILFQRTIKALDNLAKNAIHSIIKKELSAVSILLVFHLKEKHLSILINIKGELVSIQA